MPLAAEDRHALRGRDAFTPAVTYLAPQISGLSATTLR